MNFKPTLLTLGLSLISSVTMIPAASADEGQFDLTLGFGGYKPGDKRDFDDSSYKYLGLGYQISDSWELEIFGANHDTNKTTLKEKDIAVNSFGLKALYALGNDHNTVVPYVLGGINDLYYDIKGDISDNEMGLQIGAGLKIRMGDSWRLRIEADDSFYHEQSLSDISWFVGLGFVFGGHAPAPVPAAKPVPAPAPVAAPAPTPAPAPVVFTPPADSDHDGVPDSADKCPTTPAGMKVNAQGCAQLTEKVSIKLNVKFDTGKAIVKPEFGSEIEKVAKFMRDYPNTKVEVAGHTDNVGKADANKKLSQARANAVAQSLIKDHGIDASRVSAVGYGSEQPLMDNSSADGRTQNRRVTAEIDEQISTMK